MMAEAIAILLADPAHYGYDATKDITLVYGSSADNAKQRFRAEYLQGRIDELIKAPILRVRSRLYSMHPQALSGLRHSVPVLLRSASASPVTHSTPSISLAHSLTPMMISTIICTGIPPLSI